MHFKLMLLMAFLLLFFGCLEQPQKELKVKVIEPEPDLNLNTTSTTETPKIQCTEDANCNDQNKSTIDLCDLEAFECKHLKIVNCISNDNYCPPECNFDNDKDCSREDTCQTNEDCKDDDISTNDICIGSPKFCYYEKILRCKNSDNYCPEKCTFQNDNDCERKDLCQTDFDCDDKNPSTLDVCQGIPKVCTYFKTPCRDDDNFCPEHCYADEDKDCQDECTTAKHCNDYNAMTYDLCTDNKHRQCEYKPQENECVSFDEKCTPGCQANEDLDCRCIDDDNICPYNLCSASNDNDCPEEGTCQSDSDCKSPHFYATGKCSSTKTCSYKFIENTNCGIIQFDSTPSTISAKEKENCFCHALYSCQPAKLRAESDKNQISIDYETTQRSNNNCVVDFRIDKYKGKNQAEPVGYTASCRKLRDVNVTFTLEQSLLDEEQCFSALRNMFGNFPSIVMNNSAYCSGNFVNYYKDTNQWQE